MNNNPMVTPEHIKPEWYFLFAYGILRCVPSKMMRVIFFLMSVLLVPLAVLLRIDLLFLAPVFILT